MTGCAGSGYVREMAQALRRFVRFLQAVALGLVVGFAVASAAINDKTALGLVAGVPVFLVIWIGGQLLEERKLRRVVIAQEQARKRQIVADEELRMGIRDRLDSERRAEYRVGLN